METRRSLVIAVLICTLRTCVSTPNCGGTLTEKAGVITTPGFPQAFETPIHCVWIIANHELNSNSSIIVYLTQVFLTTGLVFTEYLYYEDSYKAGDRVAHVVSESSATHVKWLQVTSPYLVVELKLDRLEGHHLRALPALLDVYGFNITYEISPAVKPYQCNTIECRFLGNCYANQNYTEYGCDCFPGYSGKDCGKGPMCQRHSKPTCHNGGTCRQMGASAVSCDCPPGFTGDLCEFPLLEHVGCSDGSCVLECPYDGNPENACNCDSSNSKIITVDRERYVAVLKIYDQQKISADLPEQMTAYLRSLNITKDIEVTNISADGEIFIQAWGPSHPSIGGLLHSALSNMNRINGIKLMPSAFKFNSEPGLFLQAVAINTNPVVWETTEFILSCVAQGPPHMTFSWFKDGIKVNITQDTRNTWMRLVVLNDSNKWTALLGITSAARADAGLFRCQVVTGGRQQCRALRLHVLRSTVKLTPMSVTAHRGDNVTLTCLSTNTGGLHGKLGYSWTKNRALFPLNPGSEVWEDLYPTGSILHIYNIQKSGEYSCHVSSAVSTRHQSVYVSVVEAGNDGRGLCPAGTSWGLRWPQAAPADHKFECPASYSGYVTRVCEMRVAPFESEWNIPDFRNCMSDDLSIIYDQFQKITFGYGNITAVDVIRRYVSWILSKSKLYPGEGGAVLKLAIDAMSYLKFINDPIQKASAVEPFFKFVNAVLKSENAALSQQGVQELLTGIYLGATLDGGVSLRLSEIAAYCDPFHFSSTTFKRDIPYYNISHEKWDRESIELYIEPHKDLVFPEKSYITFIDFKNLTKFYTPMYYSTELKEGSGKEYWVASHIAVIRHTKSDGSVVEVPFGKMFVRLLMFHIPPLPRIKHEGKIVCGKYESGGWIPRACNSTKLSSDQIQCTCQDQGIYALLLERQSNEGDGIDDEYGLDIVIGALGGGALTIMLSGILLLPAWLRRRCCLIYLKLHYCFTTSLALSMMFYCMKSQWCDNIMGGWLELSLLGSGAALVAQLLLLHAELAWPAPPPPHLPRTILMLMTGLCILATLCSRVAGGGGGWGLRLYSTPFAVFVTASSLLTALHFLLCICVMARLKLLAVKVPDRNKYIQKRMGLMQRSAAIFICSKGVEITSILHYNIPGQTTSNALAVASALLGLMVFFCYIIRDETAGGLRRLFKPKETDWDCSSDYVNTSLSFFIKQGGDAESRSAPGPECSGSLAQQQHWHGGNNHHFQSSDHRERADIVKSVEFKNLPLVLDTSDRSIGLPPGAVSSVCDLVPSCPPSITSSDASTSHNPQEYVTRVCVELGILSRSAQPPPGPNEPPILLCSVDFEPYSEHQYEMTNPDSMDNCVLCVGKPKLEEIPSQSLPIKSCLKNRDARPAYCKTVEIKDSPIIESEDESQEHKALIEKIKMPVDPTVSGNQNRPENPNIDGMLDLISHDLDYLLNRNNQEQPVTSANSVKHHMRHCSKDEGKNFKVLDKIQEESL